MTSLGATGTQHGTAATGTGADEETMGALATHDGRLVGALHVGILEGKARDYNLLGPFLSSGFFVLRACGRSPGLIPGLWITSLDFVRILRFRIGRCGMATGSSILGMASLQTIILTSIQYFI